METTAYLRALGAGAVVGAAVGAAVAAGHGSMRTGVGKAMQKAGAAMDTALFDLRRMMR